MIGWRTILIGALGRSVIVGKTPGCQPGARSNRYRWARVAMTSAISIIANVLPMH